MNSKNKTLSINKYLNLLSLTLLILIILIYFFQFDIVRGNSIKDIPNIIKYNSFRFNVSNIYSNAFFYGVNPKFIIYLIIFNIFIFIPIGCILNIQKISKEKSIAMLLIISLLYELIKSLLHISQLGIDMVFLHFIGLYLGYLMTDSYVNNEGDRFLKKGILLVIFLLIFTFILQFRIIYEFFFIDLNYKTEENFVEEKDIFNGAVEAEWGKLYEPYKKYLESITKDRQLKGKFKGILLEDNYLSINISGEIHKFRIDEESQIIDKQVLDYDYNKIFVHPRLNDMLVYDLDDKAMHKINERLAILVSSDSEVHVTFDENSTLKFLCIISELYKSGVNKF